jgi:PAS domain S-box-containing protein
METSDKLLDGLAQAVLHGASEAIVVSDRDGIISFWNPGAARMFGFSVEEAMGRSLDIIIPERLRPRHWQGYREVMDGRPSRYAAGELLSVPALRKDGTQISVEFTIAPLHGQSGDVVALAAVMRDVTARFEELKTLRRQLRERTG